MRRTSVFSKPLIWGIKVWQAFAVFSIYLFFAIQFWLTLYFTSNYHRNAWREALIDYVLLKAVLTIPLWWLYFQKLSSKPLLYKLSMHLITGPIWILSWFYAYRFIQDLRDGFYLKGNGIWWDVYIPGLFYCLQFSIFHLYHYYLQTQKQKEIEQKLLLIAYNSEINALKAQIQPHFLFNTLNSISASVPSHLEHTRELIAQLADTFRYGLSSLQKERVSLHDEIIFIQQCLNLEKERYGDRLELIYDIDESLYAHSIPPLLLQPIIENAIKHGIADNVQGGIVSLSIQLANEKMIFQISDTGKGISSLSEHSIFDEGIGLSNTRKRLLHLYNEPLNIKANFPKGTMVSFHIPIKNLSDANQ